MEGVPAVAAKAAADAQEGLAVVERAGEEMVVGLAAVMRGSGWRRRLTEVASAEAVEDMGSWRW